MLDFNICIRVPLSDFLRSVPIRADPYNWGINLFNWKCTFKLKDFQDSRPVLPLARPLIAVPWPCISIPLAPILAIKVSFFLSDRVNTVCLFTRIGSRGSYLHSHFWELLRHFLVVLITFWAQNISLYLLRPLLIIVL